MAIRFEHQAAGGMIGAYAAGQAESRRRRQKYQNAALLQQREHLNRMAVRGSRYGRAARGDAMPQGQWTDPLAISTGTQHGDMTNRAKAEARARKGRLGQPIPSEWQPTWTSQDDLDRIEKEEGEKRKGADSFRRWRADTLPQIPTHLRTTAPDINKELINLRTAIVEMAISGKYDFDDANGDAQQKFDEAVKRYHELIQNAPGIDPDEGGLVFEQGVGLRPVKPGEHAEYQMGPNGPVETQWYQRQQQKQDEADALAQQQADLKQKGIEAYNDERRKVEEESYKHWSRMTKGKDKEPVDAAFVEEKVKADVEAWLKRNPPFVPGQPLWRPGVSAEDMAGGGSDSSDPSMRAPRSSQAKRPMGQSAAGLTTTQPGRPGAVPQRTTQPERAGTSTAQTEQLGGDTLGRPVKADIDNAVPTPTDNGESLQHGQIIKDTALGKTVYYQWDATTKTAKPVSSADIEDAMKPQKEKRVPNDIRSRPAIPPYQGSWW